MHIDVQGCLVSAQPTPPNVWVGAFSRAVYSLADFFPCRSSAHAFRLPTLAECIELKDPMRLTLPRQAVKRHKASAAKLKTTTKRKILQKVAVVRIKTVANTLIQEKVVAAKLKAAAASVAAVSTTGAIAASSEPQDVSDLGAFAD